MTPRPDPVDRPSRNEERELLEELEKITLNAIRWRARGNNDGKAMAQHDRDWLLRFIDRHLLQEGES